MERKVHLRRICLDFWVFGDKLNLGLGFKDLGKYFQGAEDFSFREMGRSMHYFQGSREHRPPLGLVYITIYDKVVSFVDNKVI